MKFFYFLKTKGLVPWESFLVSFEVVEEPVIATGKDPHFLVCNYWLNGVENMCVLSPETLENLQIRVAHP
jgi:hypothetical protein